MPLNRKIQIVLITNSCPCWYSDSSQDWEQSELQEWFMSSLHEEDKDRPEICIMYGGSPLFVIAWLKEVLESLYKTEVDVQDVLNEDDLDIIIEFSPNLIPKFLGRLFGKRS